MEALLTSVSRQRVLSHDMDEEDVDSVLESYSCTLYSILVQTFVQNSSRFHFSSTPLTTYL